jgi:endoglucanase
MTSLLGTTTSVLVVGCLVLAACDRPRVHPSTAATGNKTTSSLGSSASSTSASASSPSRAVTTTAPSKPATTTGPGAPVSLKRLRVLGNKIVNSSGETVRLRGFNQSGAEYACIEGWGIFDVPPNDSMPASIVTAMKRWTGANAVRVPLNEQCWLGIGVAPRYGGRTYQRAIADYVTLLTTHGFAVVLDLHRSAPGSQRSTDQDQMPNRSHSVQFWREVSAAFRSNGAVLFDLFNEPALYGEPGTERAWQCWRDGGCTLRSPNGGASYVAAGMNELIAAIRAAGARNIVIAGGINWAEDLRGWLSYRPTDPLNNVVASFHAYSFNTVCASLDCYDSVLSQLAQQVPIFAGEIGPDLTIGYDKVQGKCPRSAVGRTGFDDALFNWLDSHGASYTAWSWNVWRSCWSLISDWGGKPTQPWGRFLKDRLATAPGRG